MVCEFRFRRQPDLSELINFKKWNDNLKKFKESQLNKETSEIGKSFVLLDATHLDWRMVSMLLQIPA